MAHQIFVCSNNTNHSRTRFFQSRGKQVSVLVILFVFYLCGLASPVIAGSYSSNDLGPQSCNTLRMGGQGFRPLSNTIYQVVAYDGATSLLNNGSGWEGINNCLDPRDYWDDFRSGENFNWPVLIQKHGQINPKNNGQCGEGNPISPNTGNKFQAETDLDNASSNVPNFSRSYNSSSVATVSDIGAGWTHTFNRKLFFYADVSTNALIGISISRPNGVSYTFREQASGQWASDSDVAEKLEEVKDGEGVTTGWRYTLLNDSAEEYGVDGHLLSILDRNGLAQSLVYDDNGMLESVAGPYGHAIAFTYNADGRISQLIDSDGEITTYSYDAEGNLVEVTYPDDTPSDPNDNSTRIYHYEDPNYLNALTGITDENAQRYATWSYDAQGRATSSEHAGGQESVSITYNSDGTSTVTDANGAIRTYGFTTLHGVVKTSSITGDPCSSCGGQNAATTYDANGFVTSKTDFNSNLTTYVRDAQGLELSRTEAAGTPQSRTITTEWHPQYRLSIKITKPSVATGKNAITSISYTDSAHPKLPTNITRSGFKLDGSAVTDRTIALQYTSDGRVSQIDGPRSDASDITLMSYYPNDAAQGDNRGQLKMVSNALGHEVTYNSYDAYGQVLSMTDANGTTTSYAYGARQRLLSMTITSTQGTPRVTTYNYDGVGQLFSTTTPMGITLSYVYDDAHYLRSVMDNLGNRIEYDYDLNGNRIQNITRDPDGILVRLIDTTFDSHDRVDSINAAGSLTTLSYDIVGNLISSTDPNSNTSINDYDALNRLMQSVDALAGITAYDYDVNDRVIAVTAPSSAQTTYVYDDLGNMLSEVSPDRGARNYTYNTAGNIVSLTDARNITVDYNYDALGRVVEIDYPGTVEDVSFTYDNATATGCTLGIGRLCEMSDESGITDYAYDGFGNVVTQNKTELSITYTTSYVYDAGDNVTSMTYPGGRVVSVNRDLISRIASISATVNGASKVLVSGVQYRADNLKTAQTFGNGIDETRSYDLQGRMQEQGSNITTLGVPDSAAVALIPSLVSPASSGAVIIFSAQVSDSSVYEYQFSLQGPATGNILQIVKPFGFDNTWDWNTSSVDNGDSTISVEVRLASSPDGAKRSVSSLYTIANGDVQLVILSNSNSSSTVAGITTQYTAIATGGSGNTEYRFTLSGPSTGNVPVVVQNYSTSDVWSWLSVSSDTGAYTVSVDARNVGSSNDSEATTSVSHTLDAQTPATSVTATPDLTSPQKAGTTVSFTMQGSGGNVGQYEYKVQHYGPNSYYNDTGYNSSNTFVMPTTEANSVGTHQLYFSTRNVGSTKGSEAYTYVGYQIKTAVESATGLTVTPDLTSPQKAGTTVSFTMQGSGGNVGEYEYKVQHYGPNSYYNDTGYSSSNIFVMPTTEADSIGTHQFYFYTRNVGSSAGSEVYTYVGYQIQTSIDPATGITITPDLTSPQKAGATVSFTMQGSGGNVGQYEYKVQHYGPNSYYNDTGYSTSNTYVMPTTEANSVGTHQLYFYIRNVGSSAASEAYTYVGYQIQTSIDPATGLTFTSDLSSPQTAGATVTFTMTASGGNVGQYEYKVQHYGPNSYYNDTGYSSSNTFVMPTTEANSVGTHQLYFYTRNAGSSAGSEAYTYVVYSITSATASLDNNFRHVGLKLSVESESSIQTQVAIVSNATGEGYDYWVKSPSTASQWQQLSGVAELGTVEPDTLVYIDKDYLDVWYRSEVDDKAYRYQRISAPVTQEKPARFIKTAAGDPILAARSYSYDANGNVLDITTVQGIHNYGYDGLDRIVSDTIPNVDAIGFYYDANGNRISDIQGALTNSYSIGSGSNRLNDVNGQVVSRDAAGNTTADISPISGGSRTFEYNNANRLFKVYAAGGLVATYTYNALGQRTRKVTPTGTTVYHYDLQGQLIAETESDGRSIRDVVWQGIEPVAQIDIDDANETVTYLHTDHLATPRSGTDENGDVVWTWNSDAFGSTPASGSVTVNLRFPGQYYDSETRLHYNWNRYYDPRVGRYITSDPIGLDGGLNSFGYVGGNPLYYVDPDGTVFFVPFAISLGGAVIGAGLDLLYQLIIEGRKLECVDKVDLLISAAAGAVAPGLGTVVRPAQKAYSYYKKGKNGQASFTKKFGSGRTERRSTSREAKRQAKRAGEAASAIGIIEGAGFIGGRNIDGETPCGCNQ